MGAVPSTLHVKVKFRIDHGVAVVRGDQQIARQCLVAAINREIKQKESPKIGNMVEVYIDDTVVKSKEY